MCVCVCACIFVLYFIHLFVLFRARGFKSWPIKAKSDLPARTCLAHHTTRGCSDVSLLRMETCSTGFWRPRVCVSPLHARKKKRA
uniref:Putative secreted protein n=1 Tax=Anopheles darlingi TaxID=43151 RepID=A0A2M4DLX3_ANODA